jgi:hypothetical protein
VRVTRWCLSSLMGGTVWWKAAHEIDLVGHDKGRFLIDSKQRVKLVNRHH